MQRVGSPNAEVQNLGAWLSSPLGFFSRGETGRWKINQQRRGSASKGDNFTAKDDNKVRHPKNSLSKDDLTKEPVGTWEKGEPVPTSPEI